MARNKQISLRLSDKEYNTLIELSEKLNIGKQSVIRRALDLYYSMNTNTIDESIEEKNRVIFLPVDDGILSGKKNGRLMRNKIKLDEVTEKDDMLTCIFINPNILSFNTSYFIGLFGDSKKKYKTRNEFLQKYEFRCDDDYIMKDIMDGIEALYKEPFWKRRK